jgi:tRNA A-37 threonylcarbamoyl transferase component Bud32
MREPRRCPRCNGEVSADAPEGLCPGCLYQQALAGPAPETDEHERPATPTFVPPKPSELARRFPLLEVLELIGQGGMGAVYKARQTKLDRLVALKILPPEAARDPAFAERFTREARSLARLNHPNIVTVYDFGETDGLYYICMEYVDGKNVRQLLDAGELVAGQTMKIIPQVCDALQFAHDEGIVHRDIKPENILLDKRGRVKIADFGLAKIVGLTPTYLTLTGAHEVMGTLYYMAPEQMKRAHHVDHRADLYSLGVVFYEMLTGELPMGRFAPPSRKAHVDERVDSVVMRALSREPENRYQEANDLKREVEGLAASPSPQAGRPAAQPAAARETGFWPSVHFTIPGIAWMGTYADGEIYRNSEALVLQFEEINAFGKRRNLREIIIPLHEIASLACQWQAGAGTVLVIKTKQLKSLIDLPSGSLGRGRLKVPWSERDAAKRLAASVVQRPPGKWYEAAAGLGMLAPDNRAQMDVTVPAVGLILSGSVSLIACAIMSVVITVGFFSSHHPFGYFMGGVGVFAATVAATSLIVGGMRMLKLRSYASAVTAAVLAMVPWSPAWLIGLPFGIIALVVLRKPEVQAAFVKNRTSAESEGVDIGGKFASMFRSFGGYFLPTFAGRKPVPNPPKQPNAAIGVAGRAPVNEP